MEPKDRPSSSTVPPDIRPPDIRNILGPLVSALPIAAVCTSPSPALLPLLSPMLRFRVQIMSSANSEPWLRFLCYDAAKAERLACLAKSMRLEPHHVTGEVEIGSFTQTDILYRRVDSETLHALVVIWDPGLAFQLVYCDGDGESSWKIGQVTVAEKLSTISSFNGYATVQLAEESYEIAQENGNQGAGTAAGFDWNFHVNGEPFTSVDDGQSVEDEEYWNRYDTLARTRLHNPAAEPPPPSVSIDPQPLGEDAYFAQYDSVQPVLDSHDLDHDLTVSTRSDMPMRYGVAHTNHKCSGELSLSTPLEDNESPDQCRPVCAISNHSLGDDAIASGEASVSSTLVSDQPVGWDRARNAPAELYAVARTPGSAGWLEECQFATRRHIARSLRSLGLLAQESGIDHDEFRRLVCSELAKYDGGASKESRSIT